MVHSFILSLRVGRADENTGSFVLGRPLATASTAPLRSRL
jgi:hypothetical protein